MCSTATRIFHVLHHAGITLKVFIHILLCFTAWNTELFCQTKRTHAVDQTKVHRFRSATLLTAHLINRHTNDFCCCRRMDIFPITESIQ
ncbi:Uncharacterised protein [Vibrio cholerae]|nr:Uncharacterised protein [Vibrio cholerae]CSC86394.1 Uncharacterised protein [Vibrio cholerae]CSD10637.1 Uncharacterised protein [Vibrio cholerae]